MADEKKLSPEQQKLVKDALDAALKDNGKALFDLIPFVGKPGHTITDRMDMAMLQVLAAGNAKEGTKEKFIEDFMKSNEAFVSGYKEALKNYNKFIDDNGIREKQGNTDVIRIDRLTEAKQQEYYRLQREFGKFNTYELIKNKDISVFGSKNHGTNIERFQTQLQKVIEAQIEAEKKPEKATAPAQTTTTPPTQPQNEETVYWSPKNHLYKTELAVVSTEAQLLDAAKGLKAEEAKKIMANLKPDRDKGEFLLVVVHDGKPTHVIKMDYDKEKEIGTLTQYVNLKEPGKTKQVEPEAAWQAHIVSKLGGLEHDKNGRPMPREHNAERIGMAMDHGGFTKAETGKGTTVAMLDDNGQLLSQKTPALPPELRGKPVRGA